MIQYITIERQYGSGGSRIAQKLSRQTGMSCYGYQVLEKAGQLLHVPAQQLERYEESTTNSFLYSVNMLGTAHAADPDMLMREGHLFVAEQLAIRELASQGRAIFVGHCASQALRDFNGVLKVFIKAPLEDRKHRAMAEYGISQQAVEATIRRFDKKRSGYYSINTAKKWQDPSNYDMILDSGTLGIDGCVAVLKALLPSQD